MNLALAQHDLLAVLLQHVMPIFAALRLRRFYEALQEVSRELLASDRLTLLTFQFNSPRARLLFSTHPDLASFIGRLLPFDEGVLCDSLRAGCANGAEGGEPLTWELPAGAGRIEAYAVRPLTFEEEAYGGLLFHDRPRLSPALLEAAAETPGLTGPPPDERALADLAMDLVAQAAGVSLMRCQLDEERALQVLDTRVRLEAVTRMGKALSGLDLEPLLQRVMEVALSAVNGQVGSIVLAREGRLETVVEWGLEHEVARAIRYRGGRPVMEEVFETRLPVLFTDVARDKRVVVERRDVAVESYICIPLSTTRRTLGVINIVNSVRGQALSDRDMDLLLTLGNLASAAVENALLHEAAVAKERIETQLEIASEVQKGLLPTSAPTLPGLDLAGWNHPCEAVGGDYFDFLALEGGRAVVVIGDVSGHGLGPALIMSSARAALRSLICCEVPPEEIMARLNRLLCDQLLSPGNFITMIVATVDPKARSVVLANAGHPPPVVLNSASLSIREPGGGGMVLGVDPDAEYPLTAPVTLARGDLVAFYTDGIPDATNAAGEPFGKDRLVRTLVAHRRESAADMIEAVREAVTAFTGETPPRDDLTLVLLKAL